MVSLSHAEKIVKQVIIPIVLALCALYISSLFFYSWRCILLFTILAPTVYLIIRNIRYLIKNSESAFLMLALPATLLMCIFMPAIPSVSWDGQGHYGAADSISMGFNPTYSEADAICLDRDGIYSVGLHANHSSVDPWSPNWRDILSEEGMSHECSVLLQKESEPIEDTKDVYDIGKVNLLTIHGRIPCAIGLFIGHLISGNILTRLLLGRIFNSIFYIIVMYFAIRNLKGGKWLLTTFALSPTLLFMCANFSYDPYIISLLSFSFSRFIGLIQRKELKMTFGRALSILIPFTIAISVKAIFFFIAVIFLFMPKEKFSTKKARLWWILSVFVVATILFVSFAAPFLITRGENRIDYGGKATNISPMGQLQFIIFNPLFFLKTYGLWLLDYINPINIIRNLPISFCYLPEMPFSVLFGLLYIALYIWCALFDRVEEDNQIANHKTRIWSFLGVAACYLSLAFGLYLAFNDVGADRLQGMQIRYMLMTLYPALSICLNFGTKLRSKVRLAKHTNIIAFSTCAFTLVTSIILGFVIHF